MSNKSKTNPNAKQIEHGNRPPIIVTIEDNRLIFREKGSRRSFELDVELGYAVAMTEWLRTGRRWK